MIPNDIIQEIKQRADIVSIISEHVKLKKKGADHVGLCPFHNEKTPSFTVSGAKDMYKCFGCSKSGDSITFLMAHLKLTYPDAIKYLADKYFITIPDNYEKRIIKKPIAPVKKELPALVQWFAGRGINEETIKHFGITFTKDWMPKAQKETDTICFNYFRNEELINIKYRAAQKDFKLSKDAELIFYNIDSIKDKDYVIITEGEIDCLTVSQCTKYSTPVISVPNGAAIGAQKLEYLDNCWDIFTNIKQVVIFVDNDYAGLLLRDELARRIGFDKCLKVVYPEDCKDANEILLKHGKEKVLECIKEAVEFPIEGVLTMHDLYDDVRNYYDNGYPTGYNAGIEGFDELLTFMEGQLTTVTAVPGSGKSEFLDYISTKLALLHQWPFAVCSFENQPSSLHVSKIMEKYTGKSFAFRVNNSQRLNEDEFNNAAIFIHEYFHFINLNQIEVTLDGILAKATELVVRKGIKGLIIDPWNYIEHKRTFGQSETDYVSECLTKIKSFALKLGVHVFLVAHPTKLKKEANGKYEVPTLYSISGSAHFFNKTDNGITIYRNFDTGIVDVYVQKVRFPWLGKIGYTSFNYNTFTRQYEPINN